jgi:hypothetical protein
MCNSCRHERICLLQYVSAHPVKESASNTSHQMKGSESMSYWPSLCRCERNDVRVTGPHSPAEEHVDYEVEVGYVKVHSPAPSSTTSVLQDKALCA